VKRVLTAAVLIPAVIGLIFLAPNRPFRLTLAFLALLCLSEFLRLAARYGVEPMRLAAYVAGAWVTLPGLPFGSGAAFFLCLTLALMTLAMTGGRQLSSSLTSAGATLLGVVYIAVPFRMAGDLRAVSPHWLLYVLLINWAGDSAAYYAGRALGRRRLAPRVSPGKTWEGAAASLLLAVPAGVAYLHHFLGSVSLPFAAGLTLAANIAAQAGDLAESALKRGANVKDSGHLLPGHGGVLDRLDGLLFSVPVVYLVLQR
jgi:phosphatidate cytidylyltransferase